MWCIKCQADVAAELAPDNRRILCASCGSQIRSVPLLPSEDKTRQARELLERWSQNQWSEEPASADPSTESQLASASFGSRTAMPEVRRDEPHPLLDNRPMSSRTAMQAVQRSAIETNKSRVAPGNRSANQTHDAQRFAAQPPHDFSESNSLENMPNRQSSSKLQAFWGQMMAYAGVLALTVGAAFVLLGYFGGSQWQAYAPTGWLITTTGQMLLFLGIVTLVSGGMEQTTEEVVHRIDQLGERMIRIEWASQNHALKGPSVPAEQFQPGNAVPSQQKNKAEVQPAGNASEDVSS